MVRQKIFSAQLLNKPGCNKDPVARQVLEIANLEQSVNAFIEKHPVTATVEWHQSSAASKCGSYTQLTAIVRY